MNRPQETYSRIAAQILEHAQTLDAGRIAFRNSAGFLFSGPNTEEVLHILAKQSPTKYKFQRWTENGRWADVSKYFPVPGSQPVHESLLSLDLASLRELQNEDFNQALEEDPRRTLFALRRIYAAIAVAPQESAVQSWHECFEKIAADSANEDIVFLRSSLQLLTVVLSQVDSALRTSDLEKALQAIEMTQHHDEGAAFDVAYHLMKGKILSFSDRTAAAESFSRATAGELGEIIDRFYSDLGAYTYFSPNIGNAQQQVDEIQGSIQVIDKAASTNKFAVAVSVDAHFFRIYGPQLYFFAQQVPEIDLVVLLCGEVNEIDRAVDDGRAYSHHLSQFNQSGRPVNISYLYAPVPEWVGQAKTFYACARFFLADQLLNEYDNLYVMDADLMAEDNPNAYFRRIKDITFGTATNRDLRVLSPWRRNLAGNVAFSRSADLDMIFENLLGYLVQGLSLKTSWMLDQNALAFAMEQNRQAYTPLDQFKRPFGQPRFRSTWEKKYFEAHRK